MAEPRFIKRTICSPHPDVELGIKRSALNYIAALPSNGAPSDTGVIFYIHGWGAAYDDAYSQKLLPYLADKYNCVCIAVDYHDAASQCLLLSALRPAPDFFLKLNEHHGITLSAPAGVDIMVIVHSLCSILAKNGIKKLHPECELIKIADDYINFGVLAAVDHLHVLSEILKDIHVDKKRIFAIGTSYGGYIGLMMAKMAPNTFRMVIDNSGFSGPEDSTSVLYGYTLGKLDVDVMIRSLTCFSADPLAKNYFSHSRKSIRQIGEIEHYSSPSDSIIYSYHSTEDKIALASRKIDAARTLSAKRNFNLFIINQSDLDGRIFKTIDHGMQASMRGLFEISYNRWISDCGEAQDITDFDLGTANRLRCGNEIYVASFGQHGIALSIE